MVKAHIKNMSRPTTILSIVTYFLIVIIVTLAPLLIIVRIHLSLAECLLITICSVRPKSLDSYSACAGMYGIILGIYYSVLYKYFYWEI